MSVKQRLKEAIDHKQISIREFQREIEQLASKANIEGASYPAIHRALQGETVPSVPFLELTADFLGVRRAWLMAGDGPMTEELRGREIVDPRERWIGFFPHRENDEWRDVVRALDLPADLDVLVYELPQSIYDAMQTMNIGEVQTLAGQTVYRPAPEFREAMAMQLRAWHRFFTTWRDEVGDEAIRSALANARDELRVRFSRPLIGEIVEGKREAAAHTTEKKAPAKRARRPRSK